MGWLDDVPGSAVPRRGIAKPLLIAATTLVAARATGAIRGDGAGNAPGRGPAHGCAVAAKHMRTAG